MTLQVFDRVCESTSTTGAGTINLNGAPAGYQQFSAAGFASGDTTYYGIQNNAQWEVGIGTLTSGSPWTMARTTILASSNGGAAISLSGASTVWSDASASLINKLINGPTSGGFSNIAVFNTAGTSNWTVPAGITKCKVTCVGGGGGGGTAGTACGYYVNAAGGAGGGTAVGIFTGLTPLSTVSVTVGAGGAAAATGGTSSFGSYCSATGGGAGGGAGGVGTGGALNLTGSSPLFTGYEGGYRASYYGTGGGTYVMPENYTNTAPPAGGQGGMGGGFANGNPGYPGGCGLVIVEY